jgi:hypothetical protein
MLSAALTTWLGQWLASICFFFLFFFFSCMHSHGINSVPTAASMAHVAAAMNSSNVEGQQQ